MPHGIKNWTFKDVEKFLKQHNFVLDHIEGSHHFYILLDNDSISVCVPFHGNKSISPRTMKGIISQSGIDKKTWLKIY